MDPRTSAQDVMRCDLCETAIVQMHCDTCLINLCKACVGEHISADESNDHKVVKFQNRKSTPLYPGCKLHHKERCEMYCDQCNNPICTACIASENHSGHKIVQLLTFYNCRKKEIEKENEEMRKSIYPTYKDIASDVQNRISHLEEIYGDLSKAITKHGEDWHREVDKIVRKLKSEVDNIKTEHQNILKKHLSEINQKIYNIDDEIKGSSSVLESNDISLVLHFNRRIAEFRELPSKVDMSLPQFIPLHCQQEQLLKQFGKLSSLSLTSDKQGYCSKSEQKILEAVTSPPAKQLLDKPNIVTTIKTDFSLFFVACLQEDKIWTGGIENKIKLFSVNQGNLLKSIRPMSGKHPGGLAVTKHGDLVYTDPSDRTVNIVKNKKTETIITLQHWTPKGVCSTSSGDLLVTLNSDDGKSKVIRYSGSIEKQTILLSHVNPFLPTFNDRCISENRNFDICVVDNLSVLVINQAGQLRFTYKGHTPSPKKELFNPKGITTDSQSRILTADHNNDCVHIIDQDGMFLSFIYCGLRSPSGLCIDINDNLYVAESDNSQVKKIKYLL